MQTERTAREQAKFLMKHYLYTARDPSTGLKRHMDSDNEIDDLIDLIVQAAVEEVAAKTAETATEPESQVSGCCSGQPAIGPAGIPIRNPFQQ